MKEAIHECYRRLYKASTPSADFDQLAENPPIDFMAYEIDEAEYMQILEDVIKEFKIKKAQVFRASIHLGCSPKFKKI